MTRRIFKWRLRRSDDKVVVNGRPLAGSGFVQDGTLVVYTMETVEHDGLHARDDKYELHIVGTGHPINDENDEYFGSIVDGPFVWHVMGKKQQ